MRLQPFQPFIIFMAVTDEHIGAFWRFFASAFLHCIQ